MPHPAGERLRCEECGAELVYTKPCPCPAGEEKQHADTCCGKQMLTLGIEDPAERERREPAPAPPHH
jgi:hypothetical protein